MRTLRGVRSQALPIASVDGDLLQISRAIQTAP